MTLNSPGGDPQTRFISHAATRDANEPDDAAKAGAIDRPEPYRARRRQVTQTSERPETKRTEERRSPDTVGWKPPGLPPLETTDRSLDEGGGQGAALADPTESG